MLSITFRGVKRCLNFLMQILLNLEFVFLQTHFILCHNSKNQNFLQYKVHFNLIFQFVLWTKAQHKWNIMCKEFWRSLICDVYIEDVHIVRISAKNEYRTYISFIYYGTERCFVLFLYTYLDNSEICVSSRKTHLWQGPQCRSLFSQPWVAAPLR